MKHCTLKQNSGFILYSIILIITSHTYGQDRFNVYTVPSTAGEGLSDIHVVEVSGFGNQLWIATDMGGINLFDGANWENISAMDGLPSNRTTALTFDRDGNPWVGFRFGVGTLVNDEWITYRTADGLVNGWITCATRLRNGSLWFGSRDGINIYQDNQWSSPNDEEGFVGGYIYNIFEDADSNIWVGTVEGVNFFDGQSWTLLNTEDGLSDDSAHDFAQDKDGNIWVATFRNGINIESDTGWVVVLESEFIRDLSQGPNGNMYVGTNDGVMLYDYNDFTRITFSPEDSTDLHGYGNTVNDLIIDGNNNVFAGTWNGLGAFTSQGAIILFATDIGLCSNYITDIEEDAEGNIWFAGGSRGVSVLAQASTWQTYNYHNTFKGENVRSLFKDSRGIMWVATSSGAYFFQDGSWNRISTDNGLSHNTVYSLCEDIDGSFWYGNFGGVTKINDSDTVHYTPEDGLISESISTMLADSKGNLWFGSGQGLSYFDGDQFTTVMVGTEIATDNINDLFEDSDGNIWVATTGGASMYDGNTWRIFQSPEISNGFVRCINEVDGEIYLGTFNGLNIYRDGKFDQFHSNDGTLYHNSVFEIIKAADGTWWFATSSDGVWSTEEIDLTITNSLQLSAEQVNIYPNPVSQFLQVESEEIFKEWQIISMEGKILGGNKVSHSHIRIPVSDLDPGLHTLHLSNTKGERIIRKFIKMQ